MGYIHVYHNGQQISENGSGTNPLVMGPLNASENEVSEPKALQIKCEPGFKTYGDTTVSFEGPTADKWTICETEHGSYTSSLTISEEITGGAGRTVYVKALATDDEAPANDDSVSVKLSTIIQAV